MLCGVRSVIKLCFRQEQLKKSFFKKRQYLAHMIREDIKFEVAENKRIADKIRREEEAELAQKRKKTVEADKVDKTLASPGVPWPSSPLHPPLHDTLLLSPISPVFLPLSSSPVKLSPLFSAEEGEGEEDSCSAGQD